MKKRMVHLLVVYFGIFFAGILYACFIRITGTGYECFIYSITGYYCAGCGLTRMCIALLNLDIYQAFRYNPGAMLLLPILLYYLAVKSIYYIIDRKYEYSKIQYMICFTLVLFMILYTILRNIPQFDFLAPTLVERIKCENG